MQNKIKFSDPTFIKVDALEIRILPVENLPNCVQVVLTGIIDGYNSTKVAKLIKDLIDASYTKLIFNCGGILYISSTGIGMFLEAVSSLRKLKNDACFINLSNKVDQVFSLLGFKNYFTVRATLEEAVKSLSVEYREGVFDSAKIIICPVCDKKLKATKIGKFRCRSCKTILCIDSKANITI